MSGSAAEPLDELHTTSELQQTDGTWDASRATQLVPGLSAEEAGAVPAHLWERALLGPLDEFLKRPGKSLRTRLVALGWSLGGGASQPPSALAEIVELLHAGSLIVDDIQDDAWQRRGGPALHRIHGVPVSLNAGNWLYFWPLRLLEQLGLAPELELALHRRMHGMLLRCHHGQALDLGLCVAQLPVRDVLPVVETATRLKTGSLIELAVTLGAQVAGAPASRVEALSEASVRLGTALQMLDDLGALASRERRHKAYEDLGAGRPTWPWAWSSERREAFQQLQAQAVDVTRGARHPEPLAEALCVAIEPYGRRCIRDTLDTVMDAFRDAVGAHPALEQLAAELERLEASYG